MSDTNANGKHRHSRIPFNTDAYWRPRLTGDEQRKVKGTDVQPYLLQICRGNTAGVALITGNKAHVDHRRHGRHEQLDALSGHILFNDAIFRDAISGKTNDLSIYVDPTKDYVDDGTFAAALKGAVDRHNIQLRNQASSADNTDTAGTPGTQATPVTRYALRSNAQPDAPQDGESKDDSAADGGNDMDIETNTGAPDSGLTSTAPLPFEVTTSDVHLSSYHKEYMYEESIRKANEAIHRRNASADRAVAAIGLAVYQALYSINKTYPGLLPLIDVRNDGTDRRTGFAVWETVRESIGLNRKDDPSIHTSKTKWENANRHIPEGTDGLSTYKVLVAGLVDEYNDKAKGTAHPLITEQQSLIALDRAITGDKHGPNGTSRWASWSTTKQTFYVPATGTADAYTKFALPDLATISEVLSGPSLNPGVRVP